ncbi:hypothetical protein NM208_g16413 [Fusarium decemcellulare]|uniref:Uncharacterized protein n=1 Tax=Fusarium decemcellulare TaxID=57161 RepID=A0ACC1RCU2_9HYPO|nr:hypothetical protein NM208_g16413 [Fusarium decemcellulare]
MVQRRGTYVISAKTGLEYLNRDAYVDGGPATEECDIHTHSLPLPIQFAIHVRLTNEVKELEKESLEGLEKVGFKLDYGHDGSGMHRLFMTRAGGYTIDVGATQLIVDGKIKVVQSPGGIKGFSEKGLVLDDDRELEADIVVLAIGYDNMRTTLRKILGDKVADRVGDVWDLDDEGELNGVWRPSGHPKFWYMAGSLTLARVYSKFLALQIKAEELGMRDNL